MVACYRPKSLGEALEILSFTDCTILAGGTDLMVKKKQRAGILPSFQKPILFISGLPELKEIYKDDATLTIGAGCTLSQLIKSSAVPNFYKAVFKDMAAPGIRNAATIGGNICNASPAGDSLPLLYALEAVLIIETSCRKKQVPIESFITGPGKTVLNTGELLTAIKIPLKEFHIQNYKKLGTRKAAALSKLSFVAVANKTASCYEDIRIAFGAVAPTVVRCKDVEAEIVAMSQKGPIELDEIISSYESVIKPIDDQRSTALYRKKACMKLLKDFFEVM